MQGFNITYKDLQEQQENQTNIRVQLEASIATEEAALEADKVGFIEKEKALQSMQQGFNELVQTLRTKENEKNLATQKLQYLKEKEESIKDFLAKAEGQLQGINDGIELSQNQIGEEEGRLQNTQQEVEAARTKADEARKIVDEKRGLLESNRMGYQAIQRQQFDAEKTVAIADTSIQNLQRSVYQLTQENSQREQQLQQLQAELQQKENQLTEKKTDLEQLQEHQNKTKVQIFYLKFCINRYGYFIFNRTACKKLIIFWMICTYLWCITDTQCQKIFIRFDIICYPFGKR